MDKRYEEALERARQGMPINEVFPELYESEDERIRKWIISLIHDGEYSKAEHSMALKAIEYLERMKEQKPAEWSEEDERKRVELKTFIAQCNGFNKANRQKAFNMIDALRPQPKEERQIKEGDKVSIHCRKDRKEDMTIIYDGKVGEVIHVLDAKKHPWGHIVVRLDNDYNDGFYEDELEVLDEPTNRCLGTYKECTPISSGWVARDKNNDLHYFEVKPTRLETSWHDRDYMSMRIDSCEFSELSWEDDPIKVELLISKI